MVQDGHMAGRLTGALLLLRTGVRFVKNASSNLHEGLPGFAIMAVRLLYLQIVDRSIAIPGIEPMGIRNGIMTRGVLL
jgi:hypothetical protein